MNEDTWFDLVLQQQYIEWHTWKISAFNTAKLEKERQIFEFIFFFLQYKTNLKKYFFGKIQIT